MNRLNCLDLLSLMMLNLLNLLDLLNGFKRSVNRPSDGLLLWYVGEISKGDGGEWLGLVHENRLTDAYRFIVELHLKVLIAAIGKGNHGTCRPGCLQLGVAWVKTATKGRESIGGRPNFIFRLEFLIGMGLGDKWLAVC